MDIGKFYGPPEVFNSVMEYMTKEDIVSVSRLFQAKVGKITTKEIDKMTALGGLNCMLGAEIITKFREEHNGIIVGDAIPAFREVLASTNEHIRVVLTFSMNQGADGITFLSDDEPLNPSTIFGRVYDFKRKKFKDIHTSGTL